jgi:hypothetical protein
LAVSEAYKQSTLTSLLEADAANGLHWTQLDDCICCCSQDGCLAIGCAVSKYAPDPGYWQPRYVTHKGEAFRRHQILPQLFSYIDRNQASNAMGTVVLRLLTFEALHLTHTCCYRVHEEINGKFVRPTTEEANVIRDLERADIELLETLVAEFETKWSTYTRTFPTFMNRVWKPRMRAVRQHERSTKSCIRPSYVGWE